MIYLREKRLLVLKAQKVAGTSLDIALSMIATPDDIITPNDMEEDFFRIERGAQLPINWAKSRELDQQYQSMLLESYQISLLQHSLRQQEKLATYRTQLFDFYQKNRVFYHHIKPHELIPVMGKKNFFSVHKIVVHRHPYEQIVSQAYFDMHLKYISDFNAAIERLLLIPAPNSEYYFQRGYFGHRKPLCDTYIRYETLKSDLENLETKFDLDIIKHLPAAKSGIRTDQREAREILTPAQRQKCFKRNRLEFDFFGYAQ